jgi:BRCA1-associated protein
MHGFHLIIHLRRLSPSRKPQQDSSTSRSTSSASTYTPRSLFQALPSHKPRPTSRNNALFNPAGKDYRFGPIRIDWVDFENGTGGMKAKEREKEREGEDAKHEPRGESMVTDATAACVATTLSSCPGPATAAFVQHVRTESGSTNLLEGTVHVFRDTSTRASTSSNHPAGETRPEGGLTTQTGQDADGVTLAVLAVPSWMTPSDFLAFVAPAADGMAHLRIIRYVSLELSWTFANDLPVTPRRIAQSLSSSFGRPPMPTNSRRHTMARRSIPWR